MPKYLIWCEASQFGENEEVIEAATKEDADKAAFDLAWDHLQQYAGVHGIPDDSGDDGDEDSEETDERAYTTFQDAFDDMMNYGSELYTGTMKYN